jgi:choline transport protein
MTITFMFALGDISADLSHPSGQPWVAVILRITSSRAATIVFILIMMFMYFFCAVNQVTTSSRQVFAFARDKGLPYHEFLSRVDRKGVPANAVYVTLAYTCILALIIIGSTTAFNIILSVSATGLFTSYLVVIGTVLARKLRREPFLASRFEIPRTIGIVVNIVAMCSLSVAFLFLFFPAAPAPDAASMNWSVLIYGVVILFSGLYYYVKGRHQYDVGIIQLLLMPIRWHTDTTARVLFHMCAMNMMIHRSGLVLRDALLK